MQIEVLGSGEDRPGIVRHLCKAAVDADAGISWCWSTSVSADYAMFGLVTQEMTSGDVVTELESNLCVLLGLRKEGDALTGNGLQLVVRPTSVRVEPANREASTFYVEAYAPRDQPGLLYELLDFLMRFGVNIVVLDGRARPSSSGTQTVGWIDLNLTLTRDGRDFHELEDGLQDWNKRNSSRLEIVPDEETGALLRPPGSS